MASPYATNIKKMWNDTDVYSKYYEITPSGASYMIDSAQNYMYFTSSVSGIFILVKVNLIDGSI